MLPTNSNEKPRKHWWYVWIPIFGAFIWFGTILSMLITWLAQGGTSRPRYSSQAQSIAYISDVGADILKPLFVVGCVITAVTFVLSLVIERYLRHSGRLIPTMRRRENGMSVGRPHLALYLRHKTSPQPAQRLLLMFMVGVALSAIFTCVEYRWISRDFFYVRQLRIAYAFNAGAILEWTISLGFTFYLLTFYYDLRQAKGVRKGELNPRTMQNQRRWMIMRERFGHGRTR
ncbi:hypothetical protein K438DRAFT_1917563 [Mycena galopus ATCC 62051]|nr:hypothetical protein K438DRAFT_1917563 [Mycena galopus ATCC 62051]